MLDRGAHALAAVALAAVAQLDGLVGAGAGAARHDGPPARAREQLDLDLDGGVAPRVEDLAPDDLDDRAHRRTLLYASVTAPAWPSVLWLM